MRDFMDRRVTTLERVTSPTWDQTGPDFIADHTFKFLECNIYSNNDSVLKDFKDFFV